jgi:hypothetical protein
MTLDHGPRSCASCDQTSCAMNALNRRDAAPDVHTAYILDDIWPEYASFVASAARPMDAIIAPGIFGKARLARYAWPGAVQHYGSRATIARHAAMRRVAQSAGGVRQAVYLQHDKALGQALARKIDYRAGHLVIAQSWLPWLVQAGVLGGRTYDVLMSRYPFAHIHTTLDAVAAEIGVSSSSISDFRAPDALVVMEAEALGNARRIITPHHGIAGLYPQSAMQLAWHSPLAPAAPSIIPRTRTAFLGPTITRQRPDIVRNMARNLPKPLIVFGSHLAPADFWDGTAIESRVMAPSAMDDVATIWHPAPMVAQPRQLLQAIAAGVTVHATPGCGLAQGSYIAMETHGS